MYIIKILLELTVCDFRYELQQLLKLLRIK